MNDAPTGPPAFDGLSELQTDALCNVAFGGNGGGLRRQTLKSLEDRGLIERVVERSREGNLIFAITKWEMPLPVHIAFCAWCATQPLDFLDELHDV